MSTKGEWLSTTLGRCKTGQVAAAAMTKGTILNFLGTNKGALATQYSVGVLAFDVAIGDDTYTFPDGSVVLVQAAGAITANDSIVPDATATGKATTATTGQMAFGIALDAATALNDWILVRLKDHVAL